MEETKKLIQKRLEELYAKTKFPFTSRTILTADFGEHTDAAIQELYREGIIRPRVGVHGVLIEYLVSDKKFTQEQKREIVRNHYLKTNK